MLLKNLIYKFMPNGNNKKIKLYKDLFHNLLNNKCITLIDLGAANDIEPRWAKVSSFLDYIGFEPDERSFKDLEKTPHTFATRRIIPSVVWEKKCELKFNLCKKPKVSSVFTARDEFVNLFPDKDRFSIESQLNLIATTLDDLSLDKADFIKLDIQGAELFALKGAKKTLKKCLGLEIEIEFLQVYAEQPLYGDIVSFLEKQGFVFIDFITLRRWERKQNPGFGQCVFGDALFLRTPEYIVDMQGLDSSIISKYIAICALYNRYDLIDTIISLLQDNNTYIKALEKIKALRQIDNKARKISLHASKELLLLGHEYKSYLML